jgi:aminoglycoside phosphotransferase (APT) family kinase protein
VSGGQSNPTYFIDHGDRRMVLRKKPAGPILPGAHAVEREFRVLSALSGTAVPVPRPILIHEDARLVGTPFYLMERLDGRVFADCALPELEPGERGPVYFAMAEALAKLHSVRPEAIGLGDFGRPGNYFERQLSRWSRQYASSPGPRIAALDEIIAWLEKNLPPDDGLIAISHGDFRLGNMLFHRERPEVIGILDWELSTLGHPLADLGFCLMPWHTAPDEYGGILGLDLQGSGIPTRDAFLAHYYSCSPETPRIAPFHVAFALFRFAVIFVGIADRARAGNAASDNAAEMAPLAGRFALRALEAAGIRGS